MKVICLIILWMIKSVTSVSYLHGYKYLPAKHDSVEKKLSQYEQCILKKSMKCSLLDIDRTSQSGMILSATCEFLRTQVPGLIITWGWHSQKPMNATKGEYLLIIKTGDTCHCLRKGKTQRLEYEIGEGSTGPDRISVIALSSSVEILGKVDKLPKCPVDISISLKPPLSTIDEGSDISFHCSYEGQPRPSIIEWRFSPDIRRCSDFLRVIYNESDVTISEDRTQLHLVDVTKYREGCYICYAENDLYEDQDKSILHVRKNHYSN